jgi:hypothetical protein
MDFSDQIALQTDFFNGPEVARVPGSKLPKAITIREQIRIRTEWWQTKFILALSGNCHGSAMWAHYSEKHTGVCIGFDSEHEFFRGSEFRLWPLKPVAYRSAAPAYSPNNPERAFLTKAIEWAYEEEYRMICDLRDHRESALIDDGVNFILWPHQHRSKTLGVLVKVPHDAIKEIIVGYRADPNLIEWVKNRSRELQVRPYQAYPSDTYFRLDKRPIKD